MSSVHPKPTQEEERDSKRVKRDDSAPTPAVASSSSSSSSSAPFVHPADWPPAGPIDLRTADLPHDSADTEWWYVNGHVTTASGLDLSFFASFFRIVRTQHEDGSLEHVHALNWAITDATNKKYYSDPILDANTPDVIRKQLEDGTYELDQRMSRAFMEVVKKDRVPLPDRMFTGPVTVSKDKLDLNYHGNTYTKNVANGHYLLHCENPEKKIALTLDLTPLKPPTRQAHDGVVKIGLKQDTMFYYYIPRNTCVGTITVEGVEHQVNGEAWYDHEFGGGIKATKKVARREEAKEADGDSVMDTRAADVQAEKDKPSYAWNWFSCQLDDGSDITATDLVDTKTGRIEDNFAIVTGPAPEGLRTEYPHMILKPIKSWTSIRTTCDYPTHWEFSIPAADMKLEILAAYDDQEFMTLIAKPAFWEGRVNVSGTYRGKAIKGKGFVERHGFTGMSSLDAFFKRISKQVMEQIDMVMPLKPNYQQTRDLLADEEFDHLMDGVSLDVYRQTIVTPLREIIDRGGKSWRSFAFLLCIDCVGGNSTKFKHWLAMPEMMHVGSLIVDDIQDKSPIRRGGPSCHLVHGDPIAINAGTAAYFLSLHILQSLTPDLDVHVRNRLYEIYFLTLRAGHAGQAFDIYGLDYLMDDAVKTGDSVRLEKSVMCTHRLKSAVPAGCLARMGALVGGGSQRQIDTVGMYMESIGLAFQIIDDVLNLKGFEGNVKDQGEDIKAGKVTFPVAKAMSASRLDLTQRTQLWNTVKSKPQDNDVVAAAIKVMDDCGAIQASIDQANQLVNESWAAVDAAIPDSFYKMLLRAFGWYVLERHY